MVSYGRRGGGWTGTWKELLVRNNTVEGAMGQVFVIYDNGVIPGYNPIVIDHNTFVNITDWVKFYRHGNNTRFTNNLFVNTVSTGQTHNSHGQGPTLNWAGGHGKMATLSQGACTDSTLLARGWCWDNTDRNIHYNNNVYHDTPELQTMFAMDPWCWDVTDTNDVVTTYCDTMIENQTRWMDDSTTAQMANGVSEENNVEAPDLGFNLASIYFETHVARNMDWLDNKVHDTHPDSWWAHQEDGDWNVVQWPLPMDFSYSSSSVAATACSHGGPVGSTHHMDHSAAELGSIDELTVPAVFALNQNYPNPFNPTTEINFTMDKASDVNLTIYNMLGQKVRVLENAYLSEGTHAYTWNGQDELGQSVSTGVYLYTLTGDNQTTSKKMALMK
ncbi:MAG: T9SS type A sorting domain-containing protein [Candidatus Neomarinimicrobiota bacterium]